MRRVAPTYASRACVPTNTSVASPDVVTMRITWLYCMCGGQNLLRGLIVSNGAACKTGKLTRDCMLTQVPHHSVPASLLYFRVPIPLGPHHPPHIVCNIPAANKSRTRCMLSVRLTHRCSAPGSELAGCKPAPIMRMQVWKGVM
jgi:hypothetical protein